MVSLGCKTLTRGKKKKPPFFHLKKKRKKRYNVLRYPQVLGTTMDGAVSNSRHQTMSQPSGLEAQNTWRHQVPEPRWPGHRQL